MKKTKKIYKKLIILAVAIYVIFTIANQQKSLNQYVQEEQRIAQKMETEKETNENLNKQKDEVNSEEFIEQTARENLNMYYPNERVYVNQGM